MIQTFRRGLSLQLSKNFNLLEFQCHCDDSECRTTIVDEDLVKQLQKIRLIVDARVTISSGYRCAYYQQRLKESGTKTTRKKVSTHELGLAADIIADGYEGEHLAELAKELGIKSIGIASNWIHIDLREDKIREWKY